MIDTIIGFLEGALRAYKLYSSFISLWSVVKSCSLICLTTILDICGLLRQAHLMCPTLRHWWHVSFLNRHLSGVCPTLAQRSHGFLLDGSLFVNLCILGCDACGLSSTESLTAASIACASFTADLRVNPVSSVNNFCWMRSSTDQHISEHSVQTVSKVTILRYRTQLRQKCCYRFSRLTSSLVELQRFGTIVIAQ